MVVVGGGPIGCELAQVFAQLGSQVTQLERSGQILPREEPDASTLVRKSMESDGATILTDTELVRITQLDDHKVVTIRDSQGEQDILCDEILTAVGRTPNVAGMGLEKAEIEHDLTRGIQVNDRLQTTNPNVFAAGDVASRYQFTHAADFMARVVIQNALFMGRRKASSLLIPWATYTAPEVRMWDCTPTRRMPKTSPPTVTKSSFPKSTARFSKAIRRDLCECWLPKGKTEFWELPSCRRKLVT